MAHFHFERPGTNPFPGRILRAAAGGPQRREPRRAQFRKQFIAARLDARYAFELSLKIHNAVSGAW